VSRARKIVVGALAALTLFTAFDTGMRRDQARLCLMGDQLPCPTKLWWFQRSCETDSECYAVAGPWDKGTYPDEFALVGWGCEGAGDKPLFRNEEDEFPRCDRIEEF
jgi:hypothetical protein